MVHTSTTIRLLWISVPWLPSVHLVSQMAMSQYDWCYQRDNLPALCRALLRELLVPNSGDSWISQLDISHINLSPPEEISTIASSTHSSVEPPTHLQAPHPLVDCLHRGVQRTEADETDHRQQQKLLFAPEDGCIAFRHQDGDDKTNYSEAEQELKQHMLDLLTSMDRNPYQGSMPLERCQNILSSEQATLYNAVIGKGKGKLRQFLDRHPEITLFCLDDGKKWRVRLRSNEDYAEKDQQEAEATKAREAFLVDALCAFLREPLQGGTCEVDAFIEHEKSVVAGQQKYGKLPDRGDLVRLVLKHSKAPNACFTCEKIPKISESGPKCCIALKHMAKTPSTDVEG